ncbi:MAG: DUF418 domain-containing protein [Acidobacteria bacterium]|nr:DUF418 domain-containing protein [Acidobacteriota bacterium]
MKILTHAPGDQTLPRGPTGTSTRIEIIDIVRGFALFGVLAANMTNWRHANSTWLDGMARDFIRIFLENKSWPLFGLLFGLGVAMQFERERPAGVSIRRMAALFGFGVVTFLPFAGNIILLNYALMGVLLWPLGRLRTQWLLPLALCFVFIYAAAPLYRPLLPGADRVRHQIYARKRALTEGGFVEGMASRAKEIPWVLAGQRLVPQSSVFAMVLVGFWIGRKRLYREISANLPTVRRVLLWSLPVGFSATVASWYLSRSGWEPAVIVAWNAVTALGEDLQSVGYAAAVILLAHRQAWRPVLQPLASAGRLSLTNFMTQFLVLRLLFDRFFLALDFGQAACFLITVSLFSFQVLWSGWWLTRFRYGPAEWLWRAITYWEPPPMRRASVSG